MAPTATFKGPWDLQGDTVSELQRLLQNLGVTTDNHSNRLCDLQLALQVGELNTGENLKMLQDSHANTSTIVLSLIETSQEIVLELLEAGATAVIQLYDENLVTRLLEAIPKSLPIYSLT